MRKRKNSAKRKALEVASQAHRAFHNSIQIEDYLRQNIKEGSRSFLLEVKDVALDALGVEIRPTVSEDHNNVYVGYVMRFNIEPRRAIDNLVKFLREKTNDRVDG